MSEGLFILTTIFVAYVVFQIVGDQSASAKSKAAALKATAADQPKTETVVAEEKTVAAKPAPTKAASPKKEPASKPAATKASKAPAAKPATIQGTGLKNPKTGEVATTYSNYRFTKRWIKDALVSEGLLEKIYAGNELNSDIEAKIKTAIAQLETMDKYKA